MPQFCSQGHQFSRQGSVKYIQTLQCKIQKEMDVAEEDSLATLTGVRNS